MKNLLFCSCGTLEGEPHNYRHLFSPCGSLEYNPEVKGEFKVDLSKVKDVLGKSLCKVPQCNKEKILHDGVIIIHPFQGDQPKYFKQITISIPKDLKCGVCETSLSNHRTIRHYFVFKPTFVGGTKDDKITFREFEDKNSNYPFQKDDEILLQAQYETYLDSINNS